MREKACAKVNLSLDVIGLREDGYHELDMLMVPISLYDELEIKISDIDSFECNLDMPWDKKNLVYKAIKLFEEKYALNNHYEVKLVKNIPSQAGLGGGSSDAACALNILYKIHNIKASDSEKIELAKSLGADVPFFLFNKAARVRGIGEILEFVSVPKYSLVLGKPQEGVSTKEAFELLDKMNYPRVDMERIITKLVNKEEAELRNSLELSAIQLLPKIQDIKNLCFDCGYKMVVMSGSGSTVLVLVDDEKDTTELEKELKKLCEFVKKVETI